MPHAPPSDSDPRRRLPAVSSLLLDASFVALMKEYGRSSVVAHLRAALAAARARPPHSEEDPSAEVWAGRVRGSLASRGHDPVARVLNASGVFLHTNLGRAPLPQDVVGRLGGLLDAGCDLEFDRVSGQRGDRLARASALLTALLGDGPEGPQPENWAALVANNAAAALWLALASRVRGGRDEVVVSRGELIEIGGAFRIPEILTAAGARLIEVGTTNRTRLEDYARAIGPRTALLLKVIPSNYRIEGFVAEVATAELSRLAARAGVALLVDEGSGLLRPHSAAALRRHPAISTLLADGADLVVASADKLLGGPQAGLLIGREDWVADCAKHPLYRAVRPGRITLVALEAVLRRRLTGENMPLDGLWPEPLVHRRRLEAVIDRWRTCEEAPSWLREASIEPTDAFVGGGSAPEEPIPGDAIALPDGGSLALQLRCGDPAIVVTEREGRLWIDLRTVDREHDEELASAVLRAATLVGNREGVATSQDEG